MNTQTIDYIFKQVASELKIGDTVTVTRTAESYENNWESVWIPSVMDNLVGQIGTIIRIGSRGSEYKEFGIVVKFGDDYTNSFYLPYFILQKIKIKEVA